MLGVHGHAGFQGEAGPPAVSAGAGSQWSVVILMLCLQLPQFGPIQADAGPYPASGCLSASDILSCAALELDQVPTELPVSVTTLDLSHNRIRLLEGGSFEGLSRLETLRLGHNQLTAIQPGAFRNSSGALLKHVDLSSNQLRSLEQHYFQELSGLKELLLFNNRITQVESQALAGLGNLHKAYLSHNRLTDFPFFSIRKHSHPHLSMLDLSSNRLTKLPLEDISSLPLSVQEGLYLHNNSLLCECSMYVLFRIWEQRGFSSVRFFRREHICLVYGLQRGTVAFLQHSRYFDSCNQTLMTRPLRDQESSVSVRSGAPALLHCDTSLSGRTVTFFWVSPNSEYVAPPGNNGSFKMFPNGSLEIVAAREQDSGIYLCVAQDRQHNETWEVNVTVTLHYDAGAHESFNTGFTTLLGCVVSLVLVLMYLYLTPCHCPPWPNAQPPVAATPSHGIEARTGSAQSSILTTTPPTTTEGPGRKVSTNKHVVFLEPIKEQQNGRLRAGPGVLLGAEQQPRLLNQLHQRPGETDAFVSVFSDTPNALP